MSLPRKFQLFNTWKILGIVLGSVASCCAAAALGIWIDLNRAERLFQERAHAVYASLTQRIGSTDAALTSLVDLHHASEGLRSYEYTAFLTELLKSHEHIRTISKIVQVAREERNGFEQKRQRSGFPQFHITELNDQGKLERAAERERYYPIGFVGPFEPKFVRLLGFDVGTHPALRTALHGAIDSGKAATSLPLDLIEGGRGYLVFKAIYRGHSIPATLRERRDQVSALIALHLETTDFEDDLLPQVPSQGIKLRSAAFAPGDREGLIFTRPASASSDFLDRLMPVWRFERSLSGHAAEIVMEMTFRPSFVSQLSWLVTILAIAAAIGSSSFSVALTNRRAAVRRAREDENRLRVSELRFRDFADASSDWLWEMDKNLRFSHFSDNFTALTGVPQQDLLSKTIEESGIPGVDKSAWLKHLADLAAHRPFRDFRHPRTLTDGRIVHLSINGKPVFDEEGRFSGYRGTGSDITYRHHTEIALRNAKEELERSVEERTAELRESEERFKAVVDNSPSIIVLQNTDSRLLMVNRRFEEINAL